jgi:hypothetical protein
MTGRSVPPVATGALMFFDSDPMDHRKRRGVGVLSSKLDLVVT